MPQDAHIVARTSSVVTVSHSRRQENRPNFQSITPTREQAKHAAKTHNGWLGSAGRGRTSGIKDERAVVVMVTVAVAAFEPSRVTVRGETVQVTVSRAVQLQVTVWLNPPEGVAETVRLALSPAAMVVPDGAAKTPKSGEVFPGCKAPRAIGCAAKPRHL